MTRDDAYRVVQRAAMAAWETKRPFRDILDADPDVTAVMTPADLDAAFDLNRALINVDHTLAALDHLR
jgi:adenylosuccinate lyase